MQLDSTLAVAYYYRARSFESLGEASNAIGDYKTVIQISPDERLTEFAEMRLQALAVDGQ